MLLLQLDTWVKDYGFYKTYNPDTTTNTHKKKPKQEPDLQITVARHAFMSLNRDAGLFPPLLRLLLTLLKQCAHSFPPRSLWADALTGNQSLWAPLKPYVASSASAAPSLRWSEVVSCLTCCCSSAARREGWCCSSEAVWELSTVSPLTSSPWTTV